MTAVSNDPRDLENAESIVGVDISSACCTPEAAVQLVTSVMNELLRAGANGNFACVVMSEVPQTGSLADQLNGMAEQMGVRVCNEPLVIAVHARPPF